MGVDPHCQSAGEEYLCQAIANQSIQIKEHCMMKLIFGFLLFLVTIAVTGGLYLVIRKPEQKKIDLEKLSNACCQIVYRIWQLDDFLARIYTVVFIRIFSNTRKERISVPEKRRSEAQFPHDSGLNSTV
jgi:hypothetical protein